MLVLKLVHMEYQVNHKTQPFWVKVVHLIPNVQILAGHAVGTIHLAPTTTLHFNEMEGSCRNGGELLVPNGWCQRHAQVGFEHWVLDGPP